MKSLLLSLCLILSAFAKPAKALDVSAAQNQTLQDALEAALDRGARQRAQIADLKDTVTNTVEANQKLDNLLQSAILNQQALQKMVNEFRARIVVTNAPQGGDGGTASYTLPDRAEDGGFGIPFGAHINFIQINTDHRWVSGFRINYIARDGESVMTQWRGEGTANPEIFKIPEGYRLVGVRVFYERWIDCLTFFTRNQAGQEFHDSFGLRGARHTAEFGSVDEGARTGLTEVVGFTGRYGDAIDSLGANTRFLSWEQ